VGNRDESEKEDVNLDRAWNGGTLHEVQSCVADVLSGGRGIRTHHESPQETALLQENYAKNGALPLNDPVLVALVEAWPTLPEAIKAAVRALVESVAKK
jgi:hypothetical protein